MWCFTRLFYELKCPTFLCWILLLLCCNLLILCYRYCGRLENWEIFYLWAFILIRLWGNILLFLLVQNVSHALVLPFMLLHCQLHKLQMTIMWDIIADGVTAPSGIIIMYNFICYNILNSAQWNSSLLFSCCFLPRPLLWVSHCSSLSNLKFFAVHT